MRKVITVLVFFALVLGPGSAAGHETLRGVGASYIDPHGGYTLESALDAVGADWWYGWRPLPGGSGVPMIFGPGDLGKPINGDPDWVMYYNEPNNPEQGNAPLAISVSGWKPFLRLYPGRKYVGPSTYHVEWMGDFLGLIDVMPDALGAHCYMRRGGPWDGCKSHIQRFIELARHYGIGEIWVTEFAYVPMPGEAPDDAIRWMNDMIDWFEEQPMITRYAWWDLSFLGSESWAYGVDRNTSLVDYDTGELTALGLAYRGDPGPAVDRRGDVNGDRVIDILDLTLVGANFGASW